MLSPLESSVTLESSDPPMSSRAMASQSKAPASTPVVWALAWTSTASWAPGANVARAFSEPL